MSQRNDSFSFPKMVRHMNNKISTNFALKESRVLRMTGLTGTVNLLVGVGKLLLGIYSLSFFTCVSAFYTFGMVVAKYCALSGILRAKSVMEQYRYYFISGIILITASLLYIAYSISLFSHPLADIYHMYVALAIAIFTFTELTLNIRGVIVERNNQTPLFHAIKMINLASSLICLVLTQIALLSYADPDFAIPTVLNAIASVAAGVGATLLGVSMIIRIKRIQSERNYKGAYRQIQ